MLYGLTKTLAQQTGKVLGTDELWDDLCDLGNSFCEACQEEEPPKEEIKPKKSKQISKVVSSPKKKLQQTLVEFDALKEEFDLDESQFYAFTKKRLGKGIEYSDAMKVWG